MTREELAKAVVEMLDAQSRYFKSRTPEDLRTSKFIESRLRKAAEAIIADSEGLFGETADERGGGILEASTDRRDEPRP